VSQTISSSANRPYGLARVCRAWRVPRSTVYARRAQVSLDREPPRKRGPRRGIVSDADLLAAIHAALEDSPWVGEGYRKVWARLRAAGVRTSRARVLRLMREHGLLAPTRAGRSRGPKAHDGVIVTDRPDQMWGTDATSTLTDEGSATIFFVVDHCTMECLGIHAAGRGTRWEALEALRQAVREAMGGYREGVAAASGLMLRHDHGSQFVSDDYQADLRFLGIESSPSYVREPEGNGCAERFVRFLKEQLLWLLRFTTVAELQAALQAFKERYNRQWILQRHGYLTPRQVRESLKLEHAPVAA
jgi:transposase InsO family protein